MKSRFSKKLLAGILSLAMLCNMGFMPVMANAVEGDISIGTSSVCTHEHTADCYLVV